MVTTWTKIEKGCELPNIQQLVLLAEGDKFHKGYMQATGEPPLWIIYTSYGENPTRDISWWAKVTLPEASNIGGGPVYRDKGTVIGAMRRP